jgi:ubiquinone/menaquinone biosynthesis C-methylase UbiE
LEHIDDDRKAIAELFRILNHGGKCYVQTPFKSGAIDEDPSIATPEQRTARFGQYDHVRMYSAEGLRDRLEQSGFSVQMLKFNSDDTNYGLLSDEIILIAEKK